ncbi:MAG: hypothetical protein ACON39_03960 [Coraliomargaritaceae bacterium]
MQPPIPGSTPVAPLEALQVEEAPPEKTIQTAAVEEAPAEKPAPVAKAPEQPADLDPSLSLEDAKRQIGTEALEVLQERFNGKLTIARQPDARDQLF